MTNVARRILIAARRRIRSVPKDEGGIMQRRLNYYIIIWICTFWVCSWRLIICITPTGIAATVARMHNNITLQPTTMTSVMMIQSSQQRRYPTWEVMINLRYMHYYFHG
jgi:hypothetical protein